MNDTQRLNFVIDYRVEVMRVQYGTLSGKYTATNDDFTVGTGNTAREAIDDLYLKRFLNLSANCRKGAEFTASFIAKDERD